MTDFVQLQLRMKRDPPGYREDFLQQCRHFMSNLQIFKLQPLAKAGRSAAETAAIFDHQNKSKDAAAQKAATTGGQGPIQSRRVQEFCALIAFISFTAHLYTDEVKKLHIPQELYALLFQHCESLDPFLRKTLVQALILLQNKNLIPRLELLPALFRCFRCADKELRQSVFLHIVSDIQKLTKTNPSVSMTTALQKVVFGMLKEDHPGVALKALYVLIELWKRNVWVTEKVVNAIAAMCFGTDDKLVSAALYYFLGHYDTTDDEQEDLKAKTLAKMKEIQVVKVSLKHIKRRMKKTREIERGKKAVKRAEKELYADDEDDDSDDEREKRMKSANVNPLRMVYDPQHFAERLFYKLKTSRETFNTRMLMMNVLSKLIGMHKLLLFNFFPFIQRYLQPHQRHVTSLLSFVARATHPLVPPEVLHPLVKTIANHFVTDRSTPEVMAIGINSIREVCSRAPLVMTEELLHDLADYSRHKNKGIMAATRSLLQVFRELNPALLRRKDRGRDAQMALSVMKGSGADAERLRIASEFKLQYGAEYVHKDVEGVDLLMEAGAIKPKEDGWDSDIGDFDPDALFEDDEDDETPKASAGKHKITLTKFEIKKLRHRRGKALQALRKKIYASRGIDLDEQEDEDGNDLIDAALAADAEANGVENDDEDGDEDNEEVDMDELAGMIGEGEEGDMNGWEVDDEDMEMMGDEDEDGMEFDEDNEEDAEEDAEEEEAEEPVTKRVKSGEDISDKLVQLADVKPVVPKAAIRILTPADFKKIELLKKKRQEEGLRGARLRQKDMLNDDIIAQQERMSAFRMGSYTEVDEDDLQSSHIRKRRLDKEGRLAKMKADKEAILEAREFVKFGHRVKKDNLGLTNEEKLKSKNFVMVKHSRRVRHKAMRGFAEKQRSNSQHIKNLQKMSKNVKKGVAKRGRAKAGK